MTYCLGIITKFGFVLASDSRTSAGNDQVNTTRKMHTFVKPGERTFVFLSSGSLSCTQSILTILRKDFDAGKGLAIAATLYDAVRIAGEVVRQVADIDRPALEKDDLRFNVHLIFAGQIKDQPPALFLIYPQGNPLQATEDCPYLQIGEIKYGKPILDRGVRYDATTLEDACKLAMLSLDSTMRSNVTVGPPIDLLAYTDGELDISSRRRFAADDTDLMKIRSRWDQGLRQAVLRLPSVRFKKASTTAPPQPGDQTIELFEGTPEGDHTQMQQTWSAPAKHGPGNSSTRGAPKAPR